MNKIILKRGQIFFIFNFYMGYVFINWGINLDLIIFPTRLITFLFTLDFKLE